MTDLLTPLLAPLVTPDPLLRGLVAEWRFDRNTGLLLPDYSHFHHRGILVGPTWTAGDYGTALNFDGDSWVTIPGTVSGTLNFGYPDTYSVEIFARPTTISGGSYYVAISKGDYKWTLQIDGSTGWQFAHFTGSRWEWVEASADLNTWTHLIGTSQGAAMTMLKNGQLLDDTIDTWNQAASIDHTRLVEIGSYPEDHAASQFVGQIALVRLYYDRIIQPADAAQLFQRTKARATGLYPTHLWQVLWGIAGPPPGGQAKYGSATLTISASATSAARRALRRTTTLALTAAATSAARRTRRRTATLALTAATTSAARKIARRTATLSTAITTTTAARKIARRTATLPIALTLTAAAYLSGLGYVQTTWGHRPALALTIKDLRHRWYLLHYNSPSTQQTDQVTDASTIHRVTSDASGNIRYCKVTNPTTEAQWTNWATIQTGAIAHSEVAIARLAANTIRIFYLTDGGAGVTWHLTHTESNNNGASWSAPGSLFPAFEGGPADEDPEPPRIAAVHQFIFYTRLGFVEKRSAYFGENPHHLLIWNSLGELSSRDGLATTKLDDSQHIIVCEGGRLHYGVLSAYYDTFTSPIQLHPGSHGTPAANHTLRDPSLEQHNALFWLTYIDEHTGSPSWAIATICHTPAFAHLRGHTLLHPDTTTRRLALAAIPSTRYLYAANERTSLRSLHYHPDHPTQHVSNLTPSSYTLRTTPTGSLLKMWILNAADRFAKFSQLGTTYQAIQSLSTVILQRGYRTDQGKELAPLPPHLITRITLNRGMDQRHLEIEARSGHALLEAWRPPEVLTYEGQTIEWLTTELLAFLGFDCAFYYIDPTADQTLDTFTLKPNRTGASYLRQLMLLAGQIAWWDTDGTLQLRNFYGLGYGDNTTTGLNNEVRSSAYTHPALIPSRFRVFGDGYASAGELTWYSAPLGIILTQDITDLNITNAAIALNVQRYLWTLARTTAARFRITIPLRADIRLWRSNDLRDDSTWPANWLTRIYTYEEHSNPRRRIHQTTLTLINS